jgi:hypothetical protein
MLSAEGSSPTDELSDFCPNLLKFLCLHCGTLKSYFETIPESELKVCVNALDHPTLVCCRLVWCSSDATILFSCRSTWLIYCSVLTLTMSTEGERVCSCHNSSLPTVIYNNFCLTKKMKSSVISVNLELRHLVSREPQILFVGLWRWYWFMETWMSEVWLNWNDMFPGSFNQRSLNFSKEKMHW